MKKLTQINPPIAKQIPTNFAMHGDVRADEYSWMQEKSDDVMRYLQEENKYSDDINKPLKKLQKKLYTEIRARVTEDDISVPARSGLYLYYSRMQKGKQYSIHCRKPIKKGKEEIILDENVLAKGTKFFSLGATAVSPDHSLLAFATDTTGNENYLLQIKDLRTGKIFLDKIESVSDALWCEDGKHLYYTKENHPYPSRHVYIHKLGDDCVNDKLIYEEKDEQWYVYIHKSRSKKFIFISSSSFDATETHYLDANDASGVPQCIQRRKTKVRYDIEHHGEYFYKISDERAVNFKIDVSRVGASFKWKSWIAHNKNFSITGFSAYDDYCVITAREDGSEWIFVSGYDKPQLRRINLPEKEHFVSVAGLEADEKFVRFAYGSFLSPKAIYDYDVASGTLKIRKRQKSLGWKADKYISKRIWVKSGSANVPVSIIYKKSVKLDGSNPLLLEVYGSYGICNDPYYSIGRVSLLERGVVVAIAHTRGGGEMGWSWHKEAKLLTKHRTYQDVIAVADELVKRKYCSRSRLAISGGSAGGMTIGAVLNMRPDLANVALVYVPNADTVTSMLDTSLGGTRLHYDEIGDPRKENHYKYIKRWSPYENIKHAEYPAMLVRASLHDIRTPYWEAAKWVARMRVKTANYVEDDRVRHNEILLKIEMSAGHGGKSGRYEWIREKAYDYAWLLNKISSGSQ